MDHSSFKTNFAWLLGWSGKGGSAVDTCLNLTFQPLYCQGLREYDLIHLSTVKRVAVERGGVSWLAWKRPGEGGSACLEMST